MICPNCSSFTSNPKGHRENPWACIAILKERNNQLHSQVVELQEELEDLKADIHATEALLEVKNPCDIAIGK